MITRFGTFENPSATAVFAAVSAESLCSSSIILNGEELVRDDVTITGINGTIVTATAATTAIRGTILIRSGGFFLSTTSLDSNYLPSSNYSISAESIIFVSGSMSATLPNPAGLRGRNYILKTLTAGVLTIKTVSGLIDGSNSQIITNPYVAINLVSDNSNWWII